MKNKYKGSNFDTFLVEEKILDVSEAVALKRVIAFQIEQAMRKKSMSKTALAAEMHTSRSELDRLLDPTNTSVTLNTLVKAANSVDKKLKISFSR